MGAQGGRRVSMLEAVIFDWDGVVVDSSSAHKASWEQLAEERNLVLPEDHFTLSFGRVNKVIIPEIFRWTLDPEQIKELADRKELLYREILKETGLEPLPGALDLFNNLRDAGIPMAVGTSTPLENVKAVIEMIGAQDNFDAIISSEDVSRGKPDPEVFLKAASALGAAPENCVVFEDAIYGIQAALAAGMKAVALTTTHRVKHFDSTWPHRIVGNLEDVSLSMLLNLWK
jgi:beta-phosphoglucomutase family hydrolase